MANKANKNKKTVIARTAGLVIVIASFLLWPSYSIIAQENQNINANTEINTNTNADTTNSEGTDEEAIGDSQTKESTEYDNLNQSIEEKRQAIDELKKKSEIYGENLKIKQQETVSLDNQLSIIDIQVEQTTNDIEAVKQEIEVVNLEIVELQLKIDEKELELQKKREILSELVFIMYKYDQQTYLEIMLSHDTFSEFFNQLQYSEKLENQVKTSLDELKGVKSELESNKEGKENKKTELDELIAKLELNIASLGDQKVYKEDLLTQTEESEQKFEELLEQAKLEQEAAQREILLLETKAREKLEKEGIDWSEDTAVLLWPVASSKGISAYFHDPSYPFRKYFEHPAIDIRVSQGTPVRAAANGYVVRAKNAGMGYSYVMIIHNDEISTVYGHLSQIDVAEETYVVRGKQIGLSGGLPGTPGAGRLTTGAHLHFEVRANGIPVNPLDYLP